MTSIFIRTRTGACAIGVAVGLASLGLAHGHAQANYRQPQASAIPSTLADDQLRAEAYAYLDSLDLGFLEAPFIELKSYPRTRYGFLLRDSRRVLGLDLWSQKLGATDTYRVIDFDEWLKANMSKLAVPRQSPFDRIPEVNGASYIVLSEVASHRGDEADAKALFADSKQCLSMVAAGTTDEFLDLLAQTMSSRARAVLEDELFDRTLSRSADLALIDRFVRLYPSAGLKDVQWLRREIAAQIQIDRAHVSPDPKTATAQQMVDERVFALDQIGNPTGLLVSVSSNGRFEPTRTPEGQRIVQDGFAAVPALIACLTDRRLTYAGEVYVNGPAPSPFVQVRDVASRLLGEITGQWFGTSYYRHLTDENDVDVQRRAQEWWDRVRMRDESDMLEQGIRGRRTTKGHYVVYKPTEYGAYIVRILHSSMDVPRHVEPE